MPVIALPSLDPTNLMGYLATLGVLAAVSDRYEDAELRWTRPTAEFSTGTRPVLRSPLASVEEIADLLYDDLAAIRGDDGGCRDRFFSLKEDLILERSELDRIGMEIIRDGPGPGEPRRYEQWVMVTIGLPHVGVEPRRFSLHLLTGQQKFLVLAQSILDGVRGAPGVSREDILDAIAGEWRRRPLPSFRWDCGKDGFHYPLWWVWVARVEAEGILRGVHPPKTQNKRALLRAKITRSKYGYGYTSPASVVWDNYEDQ